MIRRISCNAFSRAAQKNHKLMLEISKKRKGAKTQRRKEKTKIKKQQDIQDRLRRQDPFEL